MSALTITTDKMVFGGDCITNIQGKKVFVPYALPEEKLEIEIVQDRGDYALAKITKILEPSPHRIIPFCKEYGHCGGCNLMHANPDYQKELRLSILRDAFEREGISVPEIQLVSGNDKGYRSRFQFHNGGLMGKKSNDIVPIEYCPCATREINHFLEEVPFDERPLGRVHVFGSEKISSIPEGYDKLVIAREVEKNGWKESKTSGKKNSSGKQKLKKIKPRFEGTQVLAENSCEVELCGKKIKFDVQGFFQSNLEVLEKSIPLITENLGGKNVLDMYSGCGTFSVFLAPLFENVTLVEHNKNAVIYAEQNLAGTKHESFGVSGEVWVKYHAEECMKRNGKYDAVVVDPPRLGMEKAGCQWLCSQKIPVVKYVSCDSATQARDSKFLLRAGYKLEKLYLLDFYPQTNHIESLAVFSHSGSENE